MYEINV